MSETLRIAVADDEPHMRAYLSESLMELGHEVVAAVSNGRDLVSSCRSLQPDLILTDIKMPDMDGIEAAVEVCRQSPVPVVLLSAYHDPATICRTEAGCVMAYLVKPIGDADLGPAITVAMHRFRELDAARTEAAALRKSLEDRKVIERAKGLLMKIAGLDEHAAYQRLQSLASVKSKKLVDVALMVLDVESALEPRNSGAKPGPARPEE
ncbi:MAG: response regulator [Pirellulales bacterium]